MKTIGLIGGMSWESTQTYYQQINTLIKNKLGGLHCAKIILISVDFHEIAYYQKTGQWEQAGILLAEAAKKLALAGADCIALCTNTMHKVASDIENATTLPFIHIATPTAKKIIQAKIGQIGLIGTRFTMEEEFYIDKLRQAGLDVIIPKQDDRTLIHNIIFDELCLGIIKPESERIYQSIIDQLSDVGAQGIILGCTEIGMLIQSASIPLFDTTYLHVEAIVDFALDD